jgi:glycosyltransferase involved in cell wall biosynthesis
MEPPRRDRRGTGERDGARERMSRPHLVALATHARLGGAERSLVELVRRLGDALRITVVVPGEGPLAAAVRDAGAACRIASWPDALATLGERARRPAPFAVARAAASFVWVGARLRAELARLAPDVVLTNGAKAHVLGALARPHGVPLVWCAREGLEDRPLSRRVLRLAGRRCDGVIAISRYVAGELLPIVPGSAPIRVVRNIVHVPDRRPPLPDDLAKAPGEVWLGVVGALTPLKGQDLFLDAAARIAAETPPARFVVVGGESYRSEAGLGFGETLKARASALGIAERTRFLGERDDAAAVIAHLDVLVQPNRGPEGLGRVILEAMAAGVAVVGVDRWGPRELIVDGEMGLLVPPDDVDALVGRMRRLVGDPALRVRLGAAARRWVRRHNDPTTLAQAFCDALWEIARLPPRESSSVVQDAAAGGR